MTGTKRIISMALALVLAMTFLSTGIFASERGSASIGFSSGGIYYMPYGISGVEGTLNLEFGEHVIPENVTVQTYTSQNMGGYVVNNWSGGTGGYTVSLGLSSFDNGLEGAQLTVYSDEQGLVSGNPGAKNPPIFLGGRNAVTLEADNLSQVVILEARKADVDPAHTALGRWGFNFLGDLTVYSHTIRAGSARAVMTWDLVVANF